MRDVDLVFLYEHAARELDVACAIVAGLRRENVSVRLLHWPTGFPQAVLQVRPKIVVLPFCYSEENYEALLAYWRSCTFFNMNWEQLLYFGNRKAKTPQGEFATRHVIHHVWSASYTEFLSATGIPGENIFLNGQPAYRLYLPPYREYYPSRMEMARRYGLDPQRRWIFFPENYNWAFYSEAMLAQFIRSGQSPEDVHVMQSFCEHSLATVLRWCAEAAREGFEIVLRPRLSTTMAEFESYVERVLSEVPERLRILQEESVREWILVSDVVVSSYSTSLIEASVAGKPVYMLEPIPIPDTLQVDWHGLLPHLKGERDFLRACRRGQRDTGARLAEWARKSLWGDGDAIRSLTEYLLALVREERTLPSVLSRQVATPGLRYVPPAWLWSAYRRSKQWYRYFRTGGIEPEYVKDALSVACLEQRIDEWTALLVGQRA